VLLRVLLNGTWSSLLLGWGRRHLLLLFLLRRLTTPAWLGGLLRLWLHLRWLRQLLLLLLLMMLLLLLFLVLRLLLRQTLLRLLLWQGLLLLRWR
jgi:hypothetical protein